MLSCNGMYSVPRNAGGNDLRHVDRRPFIMFISISKGNQAEDEAFVGLEENI